VCLYGVWVRASRCDPSGEAVGAASARRIVRQLLRARDLLSAELGRALNLWTQEDYEAETTRLLAESMQTTDISRREDHATLRALLGGDADSHDVLSACIGGDATDVNPRWSEKVAKGE
jgi:hypothetical protein